MQETQKTQKPSIDLSVDVNVPPRRAFAALVDARDLERWWTTTAESDARTGGRFRYAWEFPGAPERDHEEAGAYAEVTPDRKVSYPWAVHGFPKPTTVEFTVAPRGGGSTVTLRHSGWAGADAAAYQHHVEGWGFFLQNLKSWLEEGKDQRAAMGLRTKA